MWALIWDHDKQAADGAYREKVREAKDIKSFPADASTPLDSEHVWLGLLQLIPGQPSLVTVGSAAQTNGPCFVGKSRRCPAPSATAFCLQLSFPVSRLSP